MPDFMYYFAEGKFKSQADNEKKYGQTKGTGLSEKELLEFLESYSNKNKNENTSNKQENTEKPKRLIIKKTMK